MHYNHQRSYAFTVGVAVSEMFVIGYSAEFSANEFQGYSNGTHEIVFGIKFGSPFQANINKKDIEKMQKTTRGYDERLEYLKRENERLRKEMKEQEKAVKEIKEGASYEEVKKKLWKRKRKLPRLSRKPPLKLLPKRKTKSRSVFSN